jgi:coenzyme F420-reducing hydrogenase alpha subunit
MKMIQVGDIVKYFGQKVEVVAMSKDRKHARITRGGITQDVNTSDLKQLGQGVAEHTELAEEFDLIESIVEMIAEHNGVDAEAVWEDLESLTEDELYVFAVTSDPLMEDWQKANKRDRTDGMSQKAVNAYRRENPGSKLKTAVTTKPGKLKKGGKASKRRKSYCSRSRGQMKMHSISCAKTPDKAICKARRRWNC